MYLPDVGRAWLSLGQIAMLNERTEMRVTFDSAANNQRDRRTGRFAE